MGYISKYDTTFINFINKKYKKNFKYWDDYALWLYYKRLYCNADLYYRNIEKDLWEYSDWQTGSPRENEGKNEEWKKMEKDPFGLYKGDDKYMQFLKKVWLNEKIQRGNDKKKTNYYYEKQRREENRTTKND